ncbi:MGMT family protein [Shouchella patagoniensis]|uniref:MGMT family protein n=1 Tax=Shouchella patagoniensis TaxID=228576 RepID=UPI000994E9A3|nr:MGMT family protein [Shouchella patagoniensis]
MNSFFNQVYTLVKKIPPGEVASYGEIARKLDAPRSARVVGWAMKQAPKDVPAHRVVKKSGELPNVFFQGSSQRKRLEQEGIQFTDDGAVQMDKHSWTGI